MSQPLTLTLARRAPRTTQIFGSLLVAALLVLPFLALLPATHPLAVYALAGARHILRPGRLCDGHVPDAPGGRGRAARVYVVSLVERTALVLVGNAAFCLGSGVNCDDPRPAGAGLRLVCFPLEDQRGLFLHHDPGADLCGHAAVLSQRNRLWRQ